MIVRISGEDQYRLADDRKDELNDLDRAVITACDGGDEQAFRDSFDALLGYVRSNGERVGDDELEGSDLILPPPDLSLAEARSEFSADGLIPD